MKYWDTIALTWQLHDSLASQFVDIDKAYNITFCLHFLVLIHKQKEVIFSPRQSMDIEVDKEQL